MRRIRSDYFGIAICFIALIWICIPFVSAAGLSIISPNGGEAWEQGTSHTIEWTYTGNLDSSAWITINGAGTTRQYTTSIGSNGGGSYLWNIPDNFPLGNDYTVTIGAIDYMSGSTRSDTSDGSFTIRQKPGIISITSPNGWESWEAGSRYSIEWTYTGNLGSTVWITINGAGTTRQYTTTIGSNGRGSYHWNIPNDFRWGGDYRVTIEAIDYASGSTVSDTSSDHFTIIPKISITSPNGGESWEKGSVHTIEWTFTGDPGTNDFVFALELIGTDQNGQDHIEDVINPPLGRNGKGSYSWTVPDDCGPLTCTYVRGLDEGYDYSFIAMVGSTQWGGSAHVRSDIFNILPNPNTITLTVPNGGESWDMRSVHTIEWTYAGDPGSTVDIRYYRFDGDLNRDMGMDLVTPDSVSIGSNGKGSYSWTIPEYYNSIENFRIGVLSHSNHYIHDVSNNDVTLKYVPDTFSVKSPKEGDVWQAGSDQTIQWKYTGIIGNSQLFLNKGGLRNRIISEGTPAGSCLEGSVSDCEGSYSWKIPPDLEPGNDYSIIISNFTRRDKVGGIYITNEGGRFTIYSNSITVTSPNGGESWQQDSDQTITWTGNPESSVKIELLKGDQLSDISLSTKIGSDGRGSYPWKVPPNQIIGSDYKIKVTSVSDPLIADISDEKFSISVGGLQSPTEPIFFTAESIGQLNGIKLSWDPPSSDGGSEITNYKIYRGSSPNNELFHEQIGNVLTFVDTDILNYNKYYYRISAVNSIGEGIQSVEVSAIPSDPSKPFEFSTYKWWVKSGDSGPGPTKGTTNYFDENNIWVEGNGLHLRITNGDTIGHCAEVFTDDRFHFGEYQFQITGPVNNLDKNVVFGLFSYGPHGGIIREVPEYTNEIDIEFLTTPSQNLQYAVYPSDLRIGQPLPNNAYIKIPDTWNNPTSQTTHLYNWKSDDIIFQSLPSHTNGFDSNEKTYSAISDSNLGSFLDSLFEIPQEAMPVHINLYLLNKAQLDNLKNGNEVELIVKDVKLPKSNPTTVTIISPNGGESWDLNSIRTIKYIGDPGSTVNIEWLQGTKSGVITENAPIGLDGIGSFSWKIPPTFDVGDDYRIRIMSTSDFTISDVSNTFKITLPAKFDWRDYKGKNWMTEVKDQHSWGACWAFAVMGEIEAKYNIEQGNQMGLDLSEWDLHYRFQHGKNGGGNLEDSYTNISESGITSEYCTPFDWKTRPDDSKVFDWNRCSDYPFFSWTIDNAYVAKKADLGVMYSRDEIKQKILDEGPISVQIKWEETGLGEWIGDKDSYHGIVFVGWDDATDEWIFKNSWGDEWNDGGDVEGYGRIKYSDDVRGDILVIAWSNGVHKMGDS